MAAKYDNHPLICDVSISGSMTLHSEVMWRQPSFPYVMPALTTAGLTRENDLACLKNDITRFMRIWKSTPVEMTFNTRKKSIVVGKKARQRKVTDLEFVNELLNHMAVEGKRHSKTYMIGNHSLSEYSAILNFHALCKDHDQRHTSLYFQTEVHSAKLAEKLIHEGFKMGASLIELPNDITPKQILAPELQKLRARLKTNQ